MSRAMLVGSPQYWAPEQARGEVASPAADVFSAGVVLYRLFAGVELKLNDADALDRLPSQVRSVVRRCLRSSPGERFSHGGALAEALALARAPKRRKRWLAALALAVGGAALAYLMSSPAPKATTTTTPIAMASVTATPIAMASATTTATGISTATAAAIASASVTPLPAPSASFRSTPRRTPPAIPPVSPPDRASGPSPEAAPPEPDLLYKR